MTLSPNPNSKDSNHGNLWHESCQEQVAAPALCDDLSVNLLIVGGGFTGVSAAWHATCQGASVALLEARSIGFGGSGRNVGLVNAGLWLPPQDVRKSLGEEVGTKLNTALGQGPDLVFNLIEDNSILCEATRAGSLHCAHAPSGMTDLEKRFSQLQEMGAPVRLLNREEARARTGSPAVHGALFDARAGTIQPLGFVRGLARAAMAKGAKLYQDSPASSIRHDGNHWIARSAKGSVRADRLIMATNAYHSPAQGDIPAPSFSPVHYFQMATAPLSDNLRGQIMAGGEGCWDTATVMSSFRLDAAGRLLLGGIGNLDSSTGTVHRSWAQHKLKQLYPMLADTPFEQGWCGRIAMTGDHIPKITRIGPGALMAHGYSGRGISPGTVFGKAMAEALLSGDESTLPLPAGATPYRESFPEAKELFYEAGATAFHLKGRLLG
ncbi:NAD(P)/FAD-dependent oxidoreductase [Kiloniella sp. b19]|uniref:NAD(P)/FAD-dependent oxidoreductase n=1 Tax=Kiloniella sp. GXU_MW_B19 TaxID=3141326 RepID=UPI0031D00745